MNVNAVAVEVVSKPICCKKLSASDFPCPAVVFDIFQQ